MAFFTALGFLTRLPLPSATANPAHLGNTPAYFPLVGLLIGLVVALADWGLRLVLPPQVTSALVLILLLAITGGLHVDGLADTCDGFFATADPQRRMEIMRDSRSGSFGVAGVVVILLLQYAALNELPANDRAAALVLMTTLSRWAMSLAVVFFPYARAEGLGAAFRTGGRWRNALLATVSAVLIGLAVWGLPASALLVAVAALSWLMGWLLLRRLPGLTGDCYGAINEVTQAIVLLLMLAAPLTLAALPWLG